MTTLINSRIEKLVDALRQESPSQAVSFSLFVNAEEVEIKTIHRTARQLEQKGINMRNLKGDWIKSNASNEPPEMNISDTATRRGDLSCLCGKKAVIAVMMTNIECRRWTPQCEQCYHHHLDCSNEVNAHEIGRFGGAFGLVTWDERRDLEGAIQGEDGYLSWHNSSSEPPKV